MFLLNVIMHILTCQAVLGAIGSLYKLTSPPITPIRLSALDHNNILNAIEQFMPLDLF